ncbi:MAG: ABC transporter substrate-binding protein [Balneolaceae bacterium]
MLKKLTLLLFSAFIIAGGTVAQNSEEEIRSMLNERDEEIKELLGLRGSDYTAEQRNALKDIINDVIDFRSMAAYALGNTYDQISEEEREEFVSLFATIIRDQSLNRLDIYRADVTYDEISVDNSSAHVQTTAQLDNVRTPVSYDMEKRNDEWVITDMVIDNVSTAESYNRQFQSIIRQRGFDALLQSLRNRASRSST